MQFLVENIRLRELAAIVLANEPYYREFVLFIQSMGYTHVRDFVTEPDRERGYAAIYQFLTSTSSASLYDGVCKPYSEGKAKWYFLAWMFRDAPAQRLSSLVAQCEGASIKERQANLLNELRMNVGQLFPHPNQWEWAALSEIFLCRLEGSRRALRGTLFEGIVRRCLVNLFNKHGLDLKVGDKEIRIDDETYDVQVTSKSKKTILIPVKTRETMGGGHALLFTRDIHKSIKVAHDAGTECIPVVIAESWGGNLEELSCNSFIYLQINPNKVPIIEPLLEKEFAKLLPVFKSL